MAPARLPDGEQWQPTVRFSQPRKVRAGYVIKMDKVLPLAPIAGLAAWDLLQKHHAVLRNFPVVGHARYLLEEIGPELRQYIVSGNDEERPFSRNQRRWIYASSKLENNYFGFWCRQRHRVPGLPDHQAPHVLRHRACHAGQSWSARRRHPGGEGARWPSGASWGVPAGIGGERVGDEFGSLSSAAIEAINRGPPRPEHCTTRARAG